MTGETGALHRKAIPLSRDRMQSDLLAGSIGAALLVKAAWIVMALVRLGSAPAWFWAACGIGAGFALLVWRLRSATGPAAAMGGLVCLNLLLAQGRGLPWWRTGLPPLVALFVLTFAATRFGRRRKEALGLAEPRHGRRAAQVAANLGVAGLCGGTAAAWWMAACLAALAEATADTVSSEMGQALGGPTVMLTTLRPVAPGTDGGISLAGTLLGAAAAALVVFAAAPSARAGIVAFAAAIAGLLVDSLLGATLERRGWLGNDWVNFASTAVAAALAAWAGFV